MKKCTANKEWLNLRNYAWKHCSVTIDYTVLNIYGFTGIKRLHHAMTDDFLFHNVEQICLNSMDFKYFCSIFNLNTALNEKLYTMINTFYTENSK